MGELYKGVDDMVEVMPKKIQPSETTEFFFSGLDDIIAKLQMAVNIDKAEKEGKIIDRTPQKEVVEHTSVEKKEATKNTLKKIGEEGFTPENLTELLKNMETLTWWELQSIIAIIDELIKEWDPAMQWFLQMMKEKLKTGG